MKFRIIAVGWRMPDWISAGFNEYARRMPRETPVELIELRPDPRGARASREQVLEFQRQAIEAALPPRAQLIALDERGSRITTAGLAEWLNDWMRAGDDIAFVIGGAEGLHPAIKGRAARLVSLSDLTLPHGLARVLLAEQLYRAGTILRNHPYHRE